MKHIPNTIPNNTFKYIGYYQVCKNGFTHLLVYISFVNIIRNIKRNSFIILYLIMRVPINGYSKTISSIIKTISYPCMG